MTSLYDTLPVFLQNWVCTYAGWQRTRARFGSHFRRVLSEWERTVHGPIEALHGVQRERLDALVHRARVDTEHYRDLPPPSVVRDPQEAMARTLATIPPLEKGAYRERPEAFLFRDVPPNRLRKGKTSGTTGTALPLWYTLDTLAEEYATVWRLRRACGLNLYDAHLTFGGQLVVPIHQSTPPFWRYNHWNRQTLFSLYHMSPSNLHAYADALHSSPARYVQGYPSSLHLIGRLLLEIGRPLPRGRLTAVFTSSESLLAFHRRTIEDAFGAPVRDRYGTSELAVSMTACAENRLHVDMEFCIVEVEVHEETDDWERGPLLVTGLGNNATSFLRYRIGDIGTRAKHPCPCGRPGEVFLDVDGRIEDYVVTPDGRAIGRLDHIFKEQLDVAEAQILQETREAIEVLVVARATYTAQSERALLKEIRARLGDEIRVSIRRVDRIARERNGKFRAVRSRVGRIDQAASTAEKE